MQTKQIIDRIKDNRKSLEFIPTGFKKLDKSLDGGFLKKELVVIGGGTGAGKSYLAIHLSDQAVVAGFKVGYFSLEISNELVVARILGMRSGLKASHILYGLEDAGDIQYNKAIGHVLGMGSLFETLDDVYELKEIDRKIREYAFEFVVIDFVQNVMDQRSDSYERLSYVALHLQKIAKELNCCILILSQLSNAVSKANGEERPLEYKGSGSIATVADLGFFLDFVDKELVLETDPNVSVYHLLLQKNRRGPSKIMTQLKVKWPGGAFYEC